MGTVRKRQGKRGVSWQIDYIDPHGKRRRVGKFKTKKEADAELGKRISLIAENRYLDYKPDYKIMLGELVAEYKQNFRNQASYKTSKRFTLKRILEHFGEETLLSNIHYRDLELFRNQLMQTPTHISKTERQPASVNAEMSCLRHLFKKAKSWKRIDRSPFDDGDSLVLKVNNKRLRFLSEEEIDRLLPKCPIWLRHIVIFCLHTGARRKEVLNLKWHQVHDGHIFFEETKTLEKRQVPIDNDLQELLDSLRGRPSENVISLTGDDIGSNRTDFVFSDNSKRHQNAKVAKAFQKACERANIPFGIKKPNGSTFHSLRHSFASHLVSKGVSLKAVQELLGHENIAMTMRYAHLAKGIKQEAVAVLNGLTSKTPKSQAVKNDQNLSTSEI